eukprot:403342761
MLDIYTQKPIDNKACKYNEQSKKWDICPVLMDVIYIVKSKDPRDQYKDDCHVTQSNRYKKQMTNIYSNIAKDDDMSECQFVSIVQKTQLNIKWENLNYQQRQVFKEDERIAQQIMKSELRVNENDFQLSIKDDDPAFIQLNQQYKDKIDPFFDEMRLRQESTIRADDSFELNNQDSIVQQRDRMNEEFTNSFLSKMSPELQQILQNVRKLKTSIQQEATKCATNVRKDMQKFSSSIKKNIQTGQLYVDVGERSLRQSRLEVMRELIDVKEQFMFTRAKMEKEESLSSEGDDGDDILLGDKQM